MGALFFLFTIAFCGSCLSLRYTQTLAPLLWDHFPHCLPLIRPVTLTSLPARVVGIAATSSRPVNLGCQGLSSSLLPFCSHHCSLQLHQTCCPLVSTVHFSLISQEGDDDLTFLCCVQHFSECHPVAEFLDPQ